MSLSRRPTVDAHLRVSRGTLHPLHGACEHRPVSGKRAASAPPRCTTRSAASAVASNEAAWTLRPASELRSEVERERLREVEDRF
jgi:hypothetical protein